MSTCSNLCWSVSSLMLSKLVKFGEVEAMASHDKGELVSSDEEDVTSGSSQKEPDDLVAVLKTFQVKLTVEFSVPRKESGGGKPRRSLQTREREEIQRKSGSSGQSGELAGSSWPPTHRAARSGPILDYISGRFQAPLDMPELEPQWQEIGDLYRRTRRILHNSMYMDGDRLSPEDETAVLDILKYHQKCEEKIGPGIDYIKIIEQVYDGVTGRCFWVVRVDGTEIDFSYHKCLKEKAAKECPDLLEYYDTLYRSYKLKRADIEPARRSVGDDKVA